VAVEYEDIHEFISYFYVTYTMRGRRMVVVQESRMIIIFLINEFAKSAAIERLVLAFSICDHK
jgi:hypothetical protein